MATGASLWLNAPAGAQELYTKEEPKHFFVPPYVGRAAGSACSWTRAFRGSASRSWCARRTRKSAAGVGGAARQDDRDRRRRRCPRPRSIRCNRSAQAVVKDDAPHLPRAAGNFEDKQFGFPVWRAGKKTFAQAYQYRDDRPAADRVLGRRRAAGDAVRRRALRDSPYGPQRLDRARRQQASRRRRSERAGAMFSYRHLH